MTFPVFVLEHLIEDPLTPIAQRGRHFFFALDAVGPSSLNFRRQVVPLFLFDQARCFLPVKWTEGLDDVGGWSGLVAEVLGV